MKRRWQFTRPFLGTCDISMVQHQRKSAWLRRACTGQPHQGSKPKYVNSPESEIFSKRKELYGIYQAKAAIVKADCVYMVEGYTDVIAMHQCGLENVVANSGTALSEQQIRLLHRFTSNITLLYDGDEAGIKASIRGIDMLLAEGMNIKVLLLPDGDDPDSFPENTMPRNSENTLMITKRTLSVSRPTFY